MFRTQCERAGIKELPQTFIQVKISILRRNSKAKVFVEVSTDMKVSLYQLAK